MVAIAQSINVERTSEVESAYAWFRLLAALLISAIGSVGMWAGVVTLPPVQAEFHVARADASLPYTLAMLGFAAGAVIFGRLSDRFGVVMPITWAMLLMALSFVASGMAPNLTVFAIANLLIGLGSAAAFAPLIADISHWFNRRRGIAVTLCAAGNYVGGAIWPPVVQHLSDAYGWRANQIIVGVACVALVLPLLQAMKRQLPDHDSDGTGASAAGATASLGIPPAVLFTLLAIAGVSCCVAMSMPQVHIVAYCTELGYGAARGAEMLSLMLGFGIISRIASGFLADRIGALATLAIGSFMQGLALCFYLLSDGLTPLYIISTLFGLFQGGIVPMYALIVREYFPPRLAGTLVGLVMTATILGMALGGWLSGAIYDYTGSYTQAFINGMAWNLLNLTIVGWLLLRRRNRQALAAA